MREYPRLQVYAMKSRAAASSLKVSSEFGLLFFLFEIVRMLCLANSSGRHILLSLKSGKDELVKLRATNSLGTGKSEKIDYDDLFGYCGILVVL